MSRPLFVACLLAALLTAVTPGRAAPEPAVATVLAPASLATDPTVREALAAEASSKITAALNLFLKADAAHPDHAFILQKISKQYSDLSEEVADPAGKKRLCTAALGYAMRAIALQPNDAVDQVSVAICYGKLAVLSGPREKVDDSRQVKVFAERALELDPNLALAHYVLGRWHYEVATANGAAKFVAGLAFGQLPSASLAEAIRHLRRAAELEPQSPSHLDALADALLADHQRTAARTAYAKALALAPEDIYDVVALRHARSALEHLH